MRAVVTVIVLGIVFSITLIFAIGRLPPRLRRPRLN